MPLMRACEPLQGLLQLKPLVFGSAKSQKGKSQPYAPGLWMEFSLDRLIQNSGGLLCIYSLDKRCDSCAWARLAINGTSRLPFPSQSL